jgi:SAM-dependent methyltransferase
MDELDELGLPVWAAAERNKQPILDELLTLIRPQPGRILEISAATGQHAVHFAPHFPAHNYYVSDCDPTHIKTLAQRLKLARIPNLMGPLYLDTTEQPWPLSDVDVLYNANMTHIAPFEASVGLFQGAQTVLKQGGLLLTYGPFRVDGQHTSESNAQFHASLLARNPAWGVRDLTELTQLALGCGLTLQEKRAMPANNLLVVWRKA